MKPQESLKKIMEQDDLGIDASLVLVHGLLALQKAAQHEPEIWSVSAYFGTRMLKTIETGLMEEGDFQQWLEDQKERTEKELKKLSEEEE
jgi:hypothetical protein